MSDEEFKRFSDCNKDGMLQWLQSDHWHKWYRGLSEEEQTALRIYQGGDSYKINRFLRLGEAIGKDLQKAIQNLDNAIEKGSIPENIVAYRGFTDRVFSDIIKTDGEKNARGIVNVDDGFLSTSLSYEYCYSKKSMYQKIMMELKIRQKINGATMVMNEQGESEVLLGRKRKVMITRAETKKGILFVNGEVLE